MAARVTSTHLPSYKRPPLTEVACSVVFPSLDRLQSPHIGLVWQKFKSEYPFCEDVPPITSRIEHFDEQRDDIQVQLSNLPPLPRVWLINQDGAKIIQIQRDRFIHNWRKIDQTTEYPRYKNLIADFQKYLEGFTSFVVETQLGSIQPLQYELTYVNQISKGEMLLNIQDVGKIFPDFTWRTDKKRFLNHPNTISWNSVFELPDQFGRLHISVKSILLNTEINILFELTVRGIGNYGESTSLKNWFDLAHEWIVLAFSDLTSLDVQKTIWQLKN